ncbi:hypothetical protein RYX36_033652 [Vicia faba]
MKKQLKEMEDEASALREMQAKVEKEMRYAQGDSCLSPLRSLSFVLCHFCTLFLKKIWCVVLHKMLLLRLIMAFTWFTCMPEPTILESSLKLSSEAFFSVSI